MSFEAVTALIGTLVGSGITLVGIYLTHTLYVRNEERKTRLKQEEDAISEIFSPLVFMMEKTRSLFARIMTWKQVIDLPKAERQERLLSAVQYFVIAGVQSYPQTLEKLLVQKSGFIRSQELYIDLLTLQNYLATVVGFIFSIIGREMESDERSKALGSFSPIVQELEEAIAQIRTYSIAKVCRKQGSEYKQFFTEKKIQQVESLLDQLSIVITGEAIADWDNLLKQLGKGKK
jgi:hypothetical protein